MPTEAAVALQVRVGRADVLEAVHPEPDHAGAASGEPVEVAWKTY